MDDSTKQKFVNTLAKTQSFSGPINVGLQNQTQKSQYTAPNSNYSQLGAGGKFVDFLSRMGNQQASIGGEVVKRIAGFGKALVDQTWKSFKTTGDSLLEVGAKGVTGKGYYEREMENTLEQSRINDRMLQNAISSYKAGKITLKEYKNIVKGVSEESTRISKSADDVAFRIGDAGDRAMAVVDVGSLPLAVGKLQVAKGAGTAARTWSVANISTKALGAERATKLVSSLNRSTKALEELVAKIPSVGQLLERRAGQEVADLTIKQALKSGTKDVTLGFFLKKPFIVDSNIDDMKQIALDIAEGDFGPALARSAWVASQALRGGPLGWAAESLKRIGGGARSLVFGRGSFIDELSRSIGDGDPQAIFKHLDDLRTSDPKAFAEIEEGMKAMQEINLRKASEDVNMAVQFVKDHYVGRGIDMKNLGAKELVDDMVRYYKNYKLAVDTAKMGLIQGLGRHEWQKVAVGTFDTQSKASLVSMLRKVGTDKVNQMALINKLTNEGVQWTQNRLILNKISKIINDIDDMDTIAKEIMGITTASSLKGVPKAIEKKLAKEGYFIIRPQRNLGVFAEGAESRSLVSRFAPKGDPLFEQSVEPFKVAGTLGGAMRGAGLSPEDTNAAAYYRLTSNLAENLQDLKLSKRFNIGDATSDAQAIMHRLQNLAETKREVFDIRQLRLKEIAKELDIPLSEAKEIRKAVMQAYLDVPLQFRGLGDRIMDYNMKYNPLASGMSRLQSAGRYTYNPFFRWQEITETELLSQLMVGGKKPQYLGLNKAVSLIFRKSAEELDATVKKLDEARIFSSGFSGQGAQDQVFGRITANITKTQKRSIAGMVEKMAKNKGVSVDDMLANHFDEVGDIARVVVQYPKASAINSPLARTLNLVFFPARYNIKVASLMASKLAQQPPTIQLAVISSMFDFKDWLNSDEGLQWQSDHKESVQLFKWLTPVGSLDWTMRILGGDVESVAELGQLGGLPFGFISQMLDSQGIIDIQTPYVDPATGDVLPEYVPKTTRARAQLAIVDLLGSLFTYPGRTIGLPGKGEVLRTAANSVTGAKNDFQKQDQSNELTPKQKRQSEVVKAYRKEQNGVDEGEPNYLPGQFQGHSIPLALPPVERKTALPELSKAELRALKKNRAGGGGRSKKIARPIEKR